MPSYAFAGAHGESEALGDELGSTRFAPRYQFNRMLDDSVAVGTDIQRWATELQSGEMAHPEIELGVD